MNNYLACSVSINTYNSTWGHMAPKINTSYKGKVRYIYTNHSHYGRQAIIIDYDFDGLEGPYIHDILFDPDTLDKVKHEHDDGCVYELELTFRNYRFYFSKPKKVLSEMKGGNDEQ